MTGNNAEGDAAPDPEAGLVATLAKVALALAGVALIIYAATLTAKVGSAVHEIYQLLAATSGLIILAIVGVWGAVDALRRTLARR